ncbi:hypothetical protein ACFZC3_15425 [Streptomyces sp. NPDC007903]|uniref:hypothetical protein n=1 Tax=Streptomyces sp. NPDC007903 TaxID=3364786 RepID=UPI0036EB4232
MHARASLITIALLAATLTACGSNERSSSAYGADSNAATHAESPAPGKYDQTWETPYSDTTCGDYGTDMNAHERWAMAADMLLGARKADGATGLPADSEVTRFQEDMATACQGSSQLEVTEVGATIYLLDHSYAP